MFTCQGSIWNEVLKLIVVHYNAEELLSKRVGVLSRIKAELIKHGANFHLKLDDVAIAHLTFGREFMKPIESKQVVSKEAERKHYVVQQAKQEQIPSVTSADGDCGGGDDHHRGNEADRERHRGGAADRCVKGDRAVPNFKQRKSS